MVRRPPRALHGEPGRTARPEPDRVRVRIPHLSARGRRGRHQGPDPDVCRCRDPCRTGGLRHHLRLRRAQLSAAAVPLQVLQQAHRPLRRQLREPGALLDRRAGCGEEGGGRQLRRRNPLRHRHALRRRRRRGRRRRLQVRGARDQGRRGRPLGRQHRRHRRVGRGRGPVALLQGQPPEALGQGREEHRQRAGAGRRPGHQPRRHGADRDVGPGRHHRRRPALDRRPLPAQQDRRGPPRRYPRVHRLQHVHLALGDRRAAADLHPERDLHGGVPARLAPGEVREGGGPLLGPRGGRRAGRDGVRPCAGRARLRRASARGRRRDRRQRALHPALPRPRRVGPGDQLPPDPARQAEDGGGAHRHRRNERGRRAHLRRRPGGGCGRLALGDGWAEQHHATRRSRASMRASPRCARRSRSWPARTWATG